MVAYVLYLREKRLSVLWEVALELEEIGRSQGRENDGDFQVGNQCFQFIELLQLTGLRPAACLDFLIQTGFRVDGQHG